MGNSISSELGLHAGDWVVVRNKEEILRTLDQHGRLESLMFQPEMFAFCGKRLRVYKVAHKTCDTVTKTGGRAMHRTVHLEGVRCDGSLHGGCQAACLLFWKEAWLKRADIDFADAESRPPRMEAVPGSEETVTNAVRVFGAREDHDPTWQCQATTLLDATAPLNWWDVRQYWRDVSSGNHSIQHIAGMLFAAGYRRLIGFGHGYRLLVCFYNIIQKLRGAAPYRTVVGRIPQGQPTPVETLNLQPGEWVKVKSLTEIQETLHSGTNRNRGMLFDVEMLPFCGGRYRVDARINQIIDERTGKMIPMKTPCIRLEGVFCKATCSPKRLGCPRAIPSYWREIWLQRIETDDAGTT